MKNQSVRVIHSSISGGTGKNSGNNPLIKEEVDSEDIAEIVSRWTGIP
jgi:ATP-dependent Clp protease ATP-binding subunit ClpA